MEPIESGIFRDAANHGTRLHLNSAETDVPKRPLVALPAEHGQRFAVYCASVVVDSCLIDPWFADIADILA
jgi:hypothetical protein